MRVTGGFASVIQKVVNVLFTQTIIQNVYLLNSDICVASVHVIKLYFCLLLFRRDIPRNEVPFWRLFIFYLLMRSKDRLVGGIYVFSMCCMHYFLMSILVNLWWHWSILEKLAAWTYLNDGNCGKSGQTNLFVCMMLPVGVVLYGSVLVSWCAKIRHFLTAPEHL